MYTSFNYFTSLLTVHFQILLTKLKKERKEKNFIQTSLHWRGILFCFTKLLAEELTNFLMIEIANMKPMESARLNFTELKGKLETETDFTLNAGKQTSGRAFETLALAWRTNLVSSEFSRFSIKLDFEMSSGAGTITTTQIWFKWGI